MPLAKFQFLLGVALAAALCLRPTGLAPTKEVRTALAPDSLVRAVATGNTRLFELSIRQRVTVNAIDGEGRTALLVAVQKRDAGAVQRLLNLEANPDAADPAGRTSLMIAAAQGDVAILHMLMERARGFDAVDGEGKTAVHHALAARQYEAFALLLPRLMDLAGADDAALGAELVGMALQSADLRFVKAVINWLPEDLEWTPETSAALRAALASHDADLSRVLLCKHREQPLVESRKIPLLAQAIAEGDAELFRALLAAGADPNTLLPKGADKTFLALLSNDFLRSFVRSDEGVTMLMLASGLGRTEYVRALLEAGAERNRYTKRHKMLALYFAARTRETHCVQLLLGRGPSRDQLRVEISLATQRASVFKNGVAILETAVSTGRKGFDTPAGEYVVTDKKRSHRSSLYHVQMPYFMRLNCLDFGMHAGRVPNYPASHGCIRLPAEVAEKIFSEVPVGTVVTIN